MSDQADAARRDRALPADLGERIKRARGLRGMSTRKLAAELGVSAGQISHIETGRSAPSANTLYAMASVLGVSLDQLLGLDGPADLETAPGGHATITRYGHRTRHTAHPGVHWEGLTPGDGPVLMGLLTYDAEASSAPDLAPMGHSGVEYGFVISGVLDLRIHEDVVRLTTGDSFTFDAAAPHTLSNPGPLPTLIIWATPNPAAREEGSAHPE
jgi:transcriptional regulator with XRE-family HTH domain